jgi:[CysO sulfur-carrier protein]-S-L-cysteine hydrolase
MLRLPADVLAAVVEHCRAAHPAEACGLIAGPAGQDLDGEPLAHRHIPMSNVASEPDDTFAFDSAEQLAVYAEMDARGEDPVVLYHSHPHGPVRPSPIDLAMAAGTDCIWLIFGINRGVVAAWLIVDGQANQMDIQVVVGHDEPARPVPTAS